MYRIAACSAISNRNPLSTSRSPVFSDAICSFVFAK